MITFPNAKINLGLQILGKREDNYHEISTCMYPIPVTDALEIIPSENSGFSSSGMAIPGKSENNLILKAYHLLVADFPQLSPVQVHLHKNIPIGAGLGGGSADAAFALSMLNDIFALKIDKQKLKQYAARLGSDCPFFIENQAQIATGRGELLQPAAVKLSGNWLYLIHPGIHISTQEAYAGVQPVSGQKDLKEILKKPENWKKDLDNDFESSLFKKYPILSVIKSSLYQAGAWYASMSGSGSSVFGLFSEEPKQLSFPDHYIQLRKALD
ncbi:4-(cytidine 5'-diphospho)-2-C-methyl-D-erythritol kinase [Cyclobacterium plantarum]|uniref:4-diphosphocytidyl-2-C-methyl-D-erythritol kinase n=1 Tax=Cyclobacterium plantarum TaxID=2716263 RepID=A0ABX0HDI9_9BACT|nr:4-(cytidine 5'-diphospho)-2-C-methyl-D-erythritol kinase [Cyclobacterium plantarum]NHE58399.1 4-(cytidine 5'-diphospho)-2-C-methyl-D-erythritol kinase [Cyclobacterium plantarum]